MYMNNITSNKERNSLFIVIYRFVCSTVDTSAFKIAFEVNLVIMFANKPVVIENIPLILGR